jgi:hypothetical protein
LHRQIAPADGYTIFIGSNSTLSTNAAVFKRLPYDPLSDFAPISLLSRAPCLIIVPPISPYRTLADLVTDARKRPGALNYGAGSPGYTLYTEWMNEIAKIKATNVPFKGAGDAITAVMQGTVDYAVVDSGGAIELVRGGRLRALAVSAPKRSDSMPDVPTAIDAGLPGYLAWTWVAAAVSAKMPDRWWSASWHCSNRLRPTTKRRNTTSNVTMTWSPFAGRSGRTAALPAAGSARTAARRAPSIASRYDRQIAQLITARALSAPLLPASVDQFKSVRCKKFMHHRWGLIIYFCSVSEQNVRSGPAACPAVP